MAQQPQGIDILQMYTQDIFEDLPRSFDGVAWQDLLVPFVGVVRDLKDLSDVKVVLLQDVARNVELPLLQHGPYPNNGMQAWLQVGDGLAGVSHTRLPPHAQGVGLFAAQYSARSTMHRLFVTFMRPAGLLKRVLFFCCFHRPQKKLSPTLLEGVLLGTVVVLQGVFSASS